MIFAHQIALDLTQDQEAYCRRAVGTARFAYNWALAEWKRQYQAGEKPTATGLKRQWNALKHGEYPWVDAVHKDANQQPFVHLQTAFQKFFRHEAGYPTFKKKGQHDRFYISNDKCTVQGKRFRIPKLGWVRTREALRFQGKLLSVTVARIADRWFASFAVQIETSPPPCENQAVVGVDLGVKTLATLSTGETVEGPKPLRKLLQALRRCSKGLSRKQKGSANRRTARQKLARLHYRIACQRKDCLQKLTRTWCGASAPSSWKICMSKGWCAIPSWPVPSAIWALACFGRCSPTRRKPLVGRSCWQTVGSRPASCVPSVALCVTICHSVNGCTSAPVALWRTAT